MNDQNKTKKQLINELVELRRQVTELSEGRVSLPGNSVIDREQVEKESLRGSEKRYSPDYSLSRIADLEPGDHLCCIHDTEEEHRAVLTLFLRQGLERGEKVVYIVDTRTAETILGYLRDDGLEVESSLASGQLSILTRDDTYVREGVFDPDGMISLLRTETERALAEGYPALRLTGEMTWALRGLSGSMRLIEYEAKLNEFFPGSKCLAICQYDRRCFDPAMLLEVLRTHPIAVVGTAVYDNFYFIPSGELLNHDLPAVELQHWVQNLTEHERAREALRESENKFRDLAEKSLVGVYLIQNGIFKYVNPRLAGIFGYTVEELIDRQAKDLTLPEDWPIVEENFRKRLSGEIKSIHYNIRGITKNREVIYIEIYGSRTVYQGQPAIIGTLLDITERKRAEEALRESEKRYRELWDNAPVAYHVLNTKGIITDVNQTEAKMLGYRPEEMVGKSIFDFVLPEQRAKARKRFRQKLSDKHIPRTEDRIYVKKDGSKIYVVIDDVLECDNKGNVIGIKTTMVDITELKQTEKALKISEEKFRTLIETSADLVFQLSPTGRINYISPRVKALYGYEPEELIGKHLNITTPAKEIPRAMKAIRTVLAGKPLRNFEIRQIDKRGRIIPMEINATPMKKGKKIVGLQGIMRDITERKCVEEALRDNEAKFRALLESAPDAIMIINREGKLKLVNTQAENMFGYAREELLGKSIDLLLPKRFQRAHAKHRANYNSAPLTRPMGISRDLFGLRKNGDEFPVEISLSPVETLDGTLVISIIRDITERKQVEKKIENLNRMYATLSGVNEALVHIRDRDKFFEEVCKVSVEKGKFRMVWIGLLDEETKLVQPVASNGYVKGYLDNIKISTKKTALGKGPTGRCMREDKIIVNPNTEENADIEPWKKAMLERGYRSSCSIPIKEGNRVIGALNLYSTETHFFDEEEVNLAEELAEDISFGLNHMRAEEALRDSEAKFRRVIEQSNDGIYVLQGNRFVFINPRFTEITGYGLKEISTEDFNYRQLAAENGKKVLDEREKMLKRGEELPSRYEFKGIRKNGRKIDLEVSVTYLDWGGVPATMGIIRDVSERIRARKKLEEALEQAKQANKVKSLFLANMSHEIRTPLNAILGFTDLVRQKTEHLLGSEERLFFETIKQSGERLMHTIHEILDISQIEAGGLELNPQQLYLKELVESVVQETKFIAENRGLELSFTSTVSNAIIQADEYCIKQALTNLVENAIKYTEKGRVAITLKRKGSKFLLTIEDTGIGISEKYQEHLFEVFSQESTGYTKRFQGVGLGLALTKRYLDMSNVGVNVRSIKDVGTKFTLTIEAVAEQGARVQLESKDETEVELTEVSNNKPLVLVVEDDVSSQNLVEFYIRDFCNCLFATSVQKAKEQLFQHPVELILLDLSLIGDEDGLDFAHYLRKRKKWRNIPIIALTAHAFVTDRDNVLAAGCNDYLTKPVKQPELLKKIKQFI